jgi:hypothetical protein
MRLDEITVVSEEKLKGSGANLGLLSEDEDIGDKAILMDILSKVPEGIRFACDQMYANIDTEQKGDNITYTLRISPTIPIDKVITWENKLGEWKAEPFEDKSQLTLKEGSVTYHINIYYNPTDILSKS